MRQSLHLKDNFWARLPDGQVQSSFIATDLTEDVVDGFIMDDGHVELSVFAIFRDFLWSSNFTRLEQNVTQYIVTIWGFG